MGNEIKKVVEVRMGGNWHSFDKTVTASVTDIEDARAKAVALKESLKPFGQSFSARYKHIERIL